LGQNYDWSKRSFEDARSNAEIACWMEKNITNYQSTALNVPMVITETGERVHYEINKATDEQKQVICRVLDTIIKFETRWVTMNKERMYSIIH
jgi:hypothetical protein